MDGFIKLLICFSSFIPTFSFLFFPPFFWCVRSIFSRVCFLSLTFRTDCCERFTTIRRIFFSYVFRFLLFARQFSPFHLGMKETIPRATDGWWTTKILTLQLGWNLGGQTKNLKYFNDGRSPRLWDFTIGRIWVVSYFFFTILCFLAHSRMLDLSYLLACTRVGSGFEFS